MARPLRIQYENAYYHVTCRGNARQRIYASEADRSVFLDLLGRSVVIYQTEILAYVLMRNHFHLLVKTPWGNLQEFMRHFNISYTAYFNRRHRRSGHLYQGRYHSLLIDADNYLREVSRYIHLNPVKIKKESSKGVAACRKALGTYAWSSYPGYLTPQIRRPFLRAQEILAEFGGDTARGRGYYARYVEQGLAADLENPLELGKGHGIIGDGDFVDVIREGHLSSVLNARELPALEKIRGRVDPERIVEAVCEELKVGREVLMKKGYRGIGRGLLMEMLYRYGGMKQPQIGALMDVDYSAVSVSRKRFQILVYKNPEVRARFMSVERRISQG